MAIVDLIIKIDLDLQVKEVHCIGSSKEWFNHETRDHLIGQKIDYVLGINNKVDEGVVEIQGHFFKYQWIEDAGGGTLYLSRNGVLLEFLEQTIMRVEEGIQIYDRNGYFLHANPASEKLEYFKADDFKGKHVLDLYDLKEESSTVLTVLRTQEPVINRCDRFKMTTGKTLTTINTGYPLVIDGKVYGAVVFESDLSLLKQIKNKSFNSEAYLEDQQSKHKRHLYTFDDIIHQSAHMKDIIHFAKKVSLTDSSIMIAGATGTGKELIAQGIHSFGHRRYKPFIGINCSAIPHNLFESTFFGTEKGAFTGSIAKQGLFEMANGGTLFLDEVNSIIPEMQAKLLRVLQEKRFQRVGGSQEIRCDVRIIAAVNEDTIELIEQQKLRKDFYYRISTIKMEVPSLQERKEDIPILAQHFLDELCKKYGRKQARFSESVVDIFMQFDWPGNVRELQHVVEYAFNHALENTELVSLENLPDYLQSLKSVTHRKKERVILQNPTLTGIGTFEEQMEAVEKEIIRNTLVRYRGNITHSAKALGMSRQNLQYRIRKLSIPNE
ncbi:MAG: sigma-54 interaction domain-containing protein [Bacillota bacterium]